MGRLRSIIYKFAILIAVLSLVTSILNGVSLFTSIIRSSIVFLLTLVVIVVLLNLVRIILNQKPKPVTDIEDGINNADSV